MPYQRLNDCNVCTSHTCSNEREGGAGINDSGGLGEDICRSAKPDLLVDAPELVRWASLRNRSAEYQYERVPPGFRLFTCVDLRKVD